MAMLEPLEEVAGPVIDRGQATVKAVRQSLRNDTSRKLAASGSTVVRAREAVQDHVNGVIGAAQGTVDLARQAMDTDSIHTIAKAQGTVESYGLEMPDNETIINTRAAKIGVSPQVNCQATGGCPPPPPPPPPPGCDFPLWCIVTLTNPNNPGSLPPTCMILGYDNTGPQTCPPPQLSKSGMYLMTCIDGPFCGSGPLYEAGYTNPGPWGGDPGDLLWGAYSLFGGPTSGGKCPGQVPPPPCEPPVGGCPSGTVWNPVTCTCDPVPPPPPPECCPPVVCPTLTIPMGPDGCFPIKICNPEGTAQTDCDAKNIVAWLGQDCSQSFRDDRRTWIGDLWDQLDGYDTFTDMINDVMGDLPGPVYQPCETTIPFSPTCFISEVVK